MVLKDGPTLVLSHMVVYQMFNDPAFFTSVPVFFFMKAQAAAAVEQIVDLVVNGKRSTDCTACGDVKSIIKPVMETFAGQVVQLAATPDGLSALTPLVDYISQKRGHRPRPIVLYHRQADGQVVSLNL